MGKHIKNDRAKLLKEQDDILCALHAINDKAAELVDRFRASSAALKTFRAPIGKRYLGKRPKEAILDCLDHEDRWMTRREITDALFRGGYPMVSEDDHDTMAANIKKHADRHNLQLVGEEFGLLDWKYPNAKVEKII